MERKQNPADTDKNHLVSDKKFGEDEAIFSQFLAQAAKPKRTRPRDTDVTPVELNVNDLELVDDVEELSDDDWAFNNDD